MDPGHHRKAFVFEPSWSDDVDAQTILANTICPVTGRDIGASFAVVLCRSDSSPCLVQSLRYAEAIFVASILSVRYAEKDILIEVWQIQTLIRPIQDGHSWSSRAPSYRTRSDGWSQRENQHLERPHDEEYGRRKEDT